MTDASPRPFTFLAIGHIESIDGGHIPSETTHEETLIVLRPDLAGGLDGFAPGDRMTVIFVFDRAQDFELRQHPQGNPQRPRRGVFNLCSPHRPNPIGMTSVEILEIAGNIVRVRGLDAWPGTPILDLKPEKGGKR